MAFYKQQSGEVIDVTSPELNPQLVSGATRLSAANLAGAQAEANTITGAMLQSATPLNFQTAPPTSPASVADPATFTPAPSPEETEISKRLKEATGEQEKLASEAGAFRAGEIERAGLVGLKTQEQDLFSQFQTQRAEFGNLDKEDVRIQEQLQQESVGRGRTVGGVAPLEAGRLRQNFLRKTEKAAEVNLTAAALAGVQNKILTAKSLIDLVIEQKFGQREKELEVKLKNIDLLLKDPLLDKAKEDRALARKAALEKEQRGEAAKKEEQKNIYNTYVTAGQNQSQFTPTALYPDFASAHNAIRNAKTQEEAASIAAVTGLAKAETRSDFEQAFFREKGRLPNVAELVDFKQKEAAATREPKAGGGADEQLYNGLSTATATAVRGRVTKFATEPIIQNFATIQEGFNFASSLADTTTNPADDQGLIYSLAKALDPGSVVREGEYATAQKYAQSWIKAYGKGVEQAILGTGFLSQEARKNIKKTIEQKFRASERSYDNLYGQYAKGVNALTGRKDGDAFLTEYKIDPVLEPDQAKTSIEEDIKSIGQSLGTREVLIQELIKDYSKYFTANEIAEMVYKLIPDK